MLTSVSALYTTTASAVDAPEVQNIDGALVYNFENDKTIFSYNADEKLYPTSTVKIMTGILAVEKLGSRTSETVTITAEMLKNVSGNNIGLKEGEIVTVADLIWTLLVNGANDSAYALANIIGGEEKAASGSQAPALDTFITLMNTRARELGAYNTNYTNPSGMHDDNMYTTAWDTAILARHAYNLSLFLEAASSVKYTMPANNVRKSQQNYYNRNCLLTVYYDKNYYDAAAKGLNAGSTQQGGHSVVTTSSNGDLTYLIVVMGGKTVDSTTYSYVNASSLIDWAFDAYTYTDILSPDKIICDIPVTLSTVTDVINCVAADTLNVYLPSDVNVEEAITLSYTLDKEELQAPVKKGDKVGKVTAMYGEEILGSSDLITTADVTRSELLHTFYQIEQFSHSRFFIATVISAVVLSAIYIFGTAFIRGRKMSSKRRRY